MADLVELLVRVYTAKYLLECLDLYGVDACRGVAGELGYSQAKYRALVLYWRQRGGGV